MVDGLLAAGTYDITGGSKVVSTGIPHHNLLFLNALYACLAGDYAVTRKF